MIFTVGFVSSIFNLLTVVIMEGHWILSNTFSASIKIVIWFLSFILLVWCVTVIALYTLNYLWIPGINFSWSWCMLLLMCCSILFVSIMFRIFIAMFFMDIACSFLSCNILLWLWNYGNSGLIKWSWSIPSSSLVLKELEKYWW